MASSAEVRVFDVLGKHTRLADLVALTRTLAATAAQTRPAEWKDPAKARARAEELKLGRDEAQTTFGNALEVLERGPLDDAERSLVRALWAHVIAEAPPKGREEEDRQAESALWLAAHTPFDALPLLDRALGEAADELWVAIADRVRRIDQGKLLTLGRGEALLGCAALAMSTSTAAQKQAATLRGELRDPALARVLSGRPTPQEDQLRGELTPPPRSPLLTVVLALTGLLFVMHVVRFAARVALSYKTPADVTLSDGGIRVHAQTLMLGRTLRDREIIIARDGLVRAMREVRFPHVGFYAGLLALALGSYLGVRTFVDGVRAASPSLLLTGLLLITVGIGLDFALGSLLPGAAGRCRVVFVPLRGEVLCISGVDTREATEALAKLAQRG